MADRLHHRRTDLDPLAVQLERGEILRLHGAERAKSHMQGDPGQFHSLAGQRVQQCITEMQPRRRGCDGSGALGVAGLIPLGISGVVPFDVGRQRHLTAPVEQGLDRRRIGAVVRKLNDAPAAGGILCRHGEPDLSSIDGENVPSPHPLGRPGQTEPQPLTAGLQHQQFRQSATGAAHPQTRLEHPGVIDHQQITGLQFLEQIPDLTMPGRRHAAARRRHHQQPGAVPWLDRGLRDALRRQWIVVAAELPVPGIGHSDQNARLSGRVSISSARSFKKAAPSAP